MNEKENEQNRITESELVETLQNLNKYREKIAQMKLEDFRPTGEYFQIEGTTFQLKMSPEATCGDLLYVISYIRDLVKRKLRTMSSEEEDKLKGKTNMNHYKGNITPGKDIIFVFGSNPEGKHGAGSAKVVLQKFGAKYGKGDGLHGQSYALITTEMRKGWPRITLEQITDNVRRLYEVARKMPDKRFMVAYRNQPDQRTLCGYTGAQMMKCFLSAGEIPDNIWFSEEWYKAMNSEPNKTNQEVQSSSRQEGYR